MMSISDEEWAAMTDEQWLQRRIARCAAEGWTANKERYERILSTSSAVRGMREALERLLPFLDDLDEGADSIGVYPDTACSQECRDAVAAARAALSLEGVDKQATRGDL